MILRMTFLGIFCFSLINAQITEETWQQWDEEILATAHTALFSDYFTSEEKKLIWLTNLARTDGKKFEETFLNDYLKNKKESRYSKSLRRDLAKIKGLPLFYPEEDLYRVSLAHAISSGKKGTTGHQGFEKRYSPILGKYREVAENCAYGFDTAADILIELMIDEGIPDLGHRKNLLHPTHNSIGVSIQPHKRFGNNCVMSFGTRIK